MKDNLPKVDHTRVAPTAVGVAYLRTFTDIPLSAEIFHALENQLGARDESYSLDRASKNHLAPQIEARYKLVDKLIRDSKITQIIELAAGIAPRGINIAQSDPKIQYVELDLPKVAQDKQVILSHLNIPVPLNLTIVDGDVLNGLDIEKSVSTFSKNTPLVVVNEGLMRYLSFDEKTILATNVHKLLNEFGGIWITPDISLRQALKSEDEAVIGHTKALAQATGIDIGKNVFEDEQHARNYFEELGFNVQSHSFLEVSDQLVSPGRLGMSTEDVQRLNQHCLAFVMSINK